MNKAIKTREFDKVFLDLHRRLNLGCKSFKFLICFLERAAALPAGRFLTV